MRREELVDLNAFLTVAEERSFTRAAAKLGTSQSALSYTIRRLGVRVFQDKGLAPRPTNRDWRPPWPSSERATCWWSGTWIVSAGRCRTSLKP